MRGKLVVLDGIDGSGTSTQLELLRERLGAEERRFRYVRFPRYSENSSLFVREYLSGALGGDADDVSPYIASAFYAHDRVCAFDGGLRQYIEDGGLLLCDRYTTSNAILQGAKLEGSARFEFADWLFDYEYRRLGLPEPDRVILLNMPARLAVGLIAARAERTDIHERAGFLARAEKCGLEMAKRYGWRVIDCADGDAVRSREEIADGIYRAIFGASGQ